MYRVETNQVSVPFAYLREDTSLGSRESNKAVEEAVEQLRQEARRKLAQQTHANYPIEADSLQTKTDDS